MLVLLGVPWIFSAFGVLDAAGNKHLETLQAVFNVSDHFVINCIIDAGYRRPNIM